MKLLTPRGLDLLRAQMVRILYADAELQRSLLEVDIIMMLLELTEGEAKVYGRLCDAFVAALKKLLRAESKSS